MTRSPIESARRLLPFAVAFAVGLVMVGYATATYASFTYMRANPAVGSISTSSGFELFTLVVFVLGAFVAFVASGAALYRIQDDTG